VLGSAREEALIMAVPWIIMFWLQLNIRQNPATAKGIIATHEGVSVFLTVNDHVIGLSDGNNDYLGPKITGLEKTPWILTTGSGRTKICI
jgi:hypothetical protein